MTCRICNSEEHFAAKCPSKGAGKGSSPAPPGYNFSAPERAASGSRLAEAQPAAGTAPAAPAEDPAETADVEMATTEAIEEDEDGLLTVTAEEFPRGTATAAAYPAVGATGSAIDRDRAPAPVNDPLIFEPPAALTAGAVTVGNLWVLIVNAGVKNPKVTQMIASTGFGVTAFQMFFFAVFAFVAAALFGLVARRYREADHYRAA